MRDLALIEEATEHDATLWDEDPTFDPDYAWLDAMEVDAESDLFYAGWDGI